MTSGVGGLDEVEHEWLVRTVVTWFQTPLQQYSTRPSPAALCTCVVRPTGSGSSSTHSRLRQGGRARDRRSRNRGPVRPEAVHGPADPRSATITKSPLEPVAATAGSVTLHVYTWTDRVCGAPADSPGRASGPSGGPWTRSCRPRRGTCRRTAGRVPGPLLRRLQGSAAGLGQPSPSCITRTASS